MSLYTSLAVGKLNGMVKSFPKFPKFNRIEEINQDGIYVSFCTGDACKISTTGKVEWTKAERLRPEAKPSLLEQFAKSLNIPNQDLIDALLEADIGVSPETLGLRCEYEEGAYYPAVDNLILPTT